MTSDPQSQSQETQGPQPETKAAQGQRSWWQRLGEALRDPFLICYTKEKLDKQISQKVDSISKKQNIEGKMSAKIEGKAEEIKNKLEGKVIKELEKRYTELTNRVRATILTIIFTITLGTILFTPTISNILSLDVLKSDIETLKEDIEDLRDN